MSVHIILDSTANLSPLIRGRFKVIPLSIRFCEEEFIDGVTIDHKRFYEMLIESNTVPSTSQPPPSAFAQLYAEIVHSGDTAVVITLSSKLSGTYQSAVIAAENFSGSIYVVDSRSVSIGTGILAELALKMADNGKDAWEIAETIEKERENICVVAMLDTLEYLKRGGRISKTVAFAGGLLAIKPVVSLDNGEVEILGKARGSKQGNNLLVSEITKAGGVDFSRPVLLGYTGLDDSLLKKYVDDSAFLWQGHIDSLQYAAIGAVVGTHAGPGAIAVAFFKN